MVTLNFQECFETIKVVDGKLLNLKYHQKRVDKTRENFGFTNRVDILKEEFNLPKKGEFRLRVDYAEEIKSFTCKKIINRKFKEFKLVNSNIEYSFKYIQRDKLDALKTDYKEVIIVTDGFLRDTTIANIALQIDGVWFTPKNPLLEGTTRARLIDKGFIECKNLTIEDLKKAQNFAIMNALIGFYTVREAKIEFELGFKRTI